MNQHVIQPTAEPVGSIADITRTDEAWRFRSLALNQRRHSHRYRQWAREAAAKGHRAAADAFTKSAQKYAADALWYWRRGNPKT